MSGVDDRERELLADVLGRVEDPRRKVWDVRDLMAETFPEPRYAVEGLLPPGAAFLGGAPKIGKSYFVLGLCAAIATGGRALGTIEVERGEALYLALEDSPRRLQARLRQVLDGSPPEGFHLTTSWERIGEGGLERLASWLDDHPATRLIVVDVWPRLRPPGTRSSDYFRVDYDAVVPLQALAVDRGVAVLVIVHTRKAESEDFVDAIQGTLGTAAAADTLLVVKRSRGEADAKLFVTGRDVREQELALQFSPAAGTWTSLGDAMRYDVGETRRELLEAIEAHGSLTPKEASEVTGVGYELAKKTLQRMLADGQLSAKRGRYALVPPVPGVPMSPDELPERDKGTGGTGVQEDVT